jgi:energy-coupling factor transport system substrate-specific component
MVTSDAESTGRGRSATGLLSMWRNTRMVVLTAICASLFAALLIPFKLLPLIPGVTELRPANAIPILCSFLFGPAAAWGAAIGNVIGDFFGGFGPGALFGAAGNFLYGLLPYRLWRAFSDRDPTPATPLQWLAFAAVLAIASAACALVVGWGLNALGFVPFAALANIIFFNNFAVSLVLAPLLLHAVYGRVRASGLAYDELRAEKPRRRSTRWFGAGVVAFATSGGMLVGNLVALGYWSVPGGGIIAAQVTTAVTPFIVLLILGALLL